MCNLDGSDGDVGKDGLSLRKNAQKVAGTRKLNSNALGDAPEMGPLRYKKRM